MLLSEKIKLAEKKIIEAYLKNNGKLFISFSGGKDSTILMFIALRLYPHLPVVFSNTTNELSEVIKYVKQYKNVIHVSPAMPFKKVLSTYGFPLVSKEISQKVNELKRTNGKKTRMTRLYGDAKGNGQLSVSWRFLAEQTFDVTHKCCQILKKDPLENWAKNNGNLKPLIALMSDESKLRQQLALYGKDDGKKIYPFLKTGWTDEDIWEYAEKYNIRFAECYYDRVINGVLVKARKQTGCEFCGFGITYEEEDRFERSRIISPKKYAKTMEITNNGITFKEAINIVRHAERKPLLDLYGVKINKKESLSPLKDQYSVAATTIMKKCPHCESKKLKKQKDRIVIFYDSPDPYNKKIRKILVTNHDYICQSCGEKFTNDLHMFNVEYKITNRLHNYVLEAREKRDTFSEISDRTGISISKIRNISLIS